MTVICISSKTCGEKKCPHFVPHEQTIECITSGIPCPYHPRLSALCAPLPEDITIYTDYRKNYDF